MRLLLILTLLILPVAGCKPKAQKADTTTGSQSTSYQPGAGVAQNVRKAAARTEVKNELNQIKIFIEYAYGPTGKMPPASQTYAALKQEAPSIAKMVDDKVISLVPMPQREGIWAYETAALQSSGQVLFNSSIDMMDAATLKQKLGQ